MNIKNLKKKAIRCPKTHKFFKETSYLGIVGCKTQIKFILESWNLYCTCIWLLQRLTKNFEHHKFKKKLIFGHCRVQNAIKIHSRKLKFVLQVHLTFVKSVKISTNWNLADFFILDLFQLFYRPQKIFCRGLGHIFECSFRTLGAQKWCI